MKIDIYVNPSKGRMATLPTATPESAAQAAQPGWILHTEAATSQAAINITRNWQRSAWASGSTDQEPTWEVIDFSTRAGYYHYKTFYPCKTLSLVGDDNLIREFQYVSLVGDVISSLERNISFDAGKEMLTIAGIFPEDGPPVYMHCTAKMWARIKAAVIALHQPQ